MNVFFGTFQLADNMKEYMNDFVTNTVKNPRVGDKWKLKRDYYIQTTDSSNLEFFKTYSIMTISCVDCKLDLIVAILNNGRRVIFKLTEFFIHADAFEYMGNCFPK